MDQNVEIQTYIDVLKRRKFHFFVPALLVFCIVASVTMLLPSIYSTSSTILIEAQNVPKELVKTTVSGYVEERMQTIAQVVLGRVSLLQLINRLGLYQEMRDTHTTEEIVAKMQKDVSLTPVQAEVINPASGKAATATIAFTIGYKGKSPQVVTQVVNELTSAFLEQNLKDREQKAKTAVTFLEKQRDELDQQIKRQEEKIAVFKQAHLNELPELMQLNLQSAERLDKDIASLDEQIRAMVNRKVYLEGQLATIDPLQSGRGVMSPTEELETLRREFIALKASKSPNHPDVLAMSARIRGLEQEYGIGASSNEIEREIRATENELAQLREKYAAKHPDVRSVEKKLEDLKSQAQALSQRNVQSQARKGSIQAENPAYITLKTQVAATELDIQSLRNERANLIGRYEAFRSRLEKSPQVEQEYKTLVRDMTDAQQQYQQIIARLMSAQEALVLEQEQVGEKMTLIAPPTVPEKPSSPNRLALMLVGFVLALGSGVGVAALAEFMDTAVHSADELAEITNVPVLAVIPYITTDEELAQRRSRRILLLGASVGGVVALLGIVHFMIRPLDVIMVQIIRKISLYL